MMAETTPVALPDLDTALPSRRWPGCGTSNRLPRRQGAALIEYRVTGIASRHAGLTAL